MKIRWKALIAAGALVLAGIALWAFAASRVGGGNRVSIIEDAAGLRPRTVIADVHLRDGTPVAGAVVWARNSSGGNEATTDGSGRAEIALGEWQVDAILVNGVQIHEWRLKPLDVSKGVKLTVLLQTNIPPSSKSK